MKKIALSLALLLAFAGSALAQTCPGGSTCNPIESYVYSSPTATTPLVSSLRVPVIPSTSASTLEYTPSTTWAQSAANLSDLGNLGTGLNNLTTAALSGAGTACIHANAAGLLSRASGDCASGGSGSVTSVAMTVPGFLTIGGSPITTSGTLALGLSNEVANTFFGGPGSGAAATPGFRSIVTADLPTTGVSAGTYTNPTVTFNAQGQATAASNGAAGGTTVWTGTVTGTNSYVSSSVQGSFANGPYKVFCGPWANASTGAVTLAVDSAAALPVDIQFGQTATTQAGSGDIPGGNTSLCLQQNAGGTAWVKQTQLPGGVLRDPAAHTVTAFEWSTGYTFVFTTGTPTLTFPSVSGGLSAQGGILVQTVGVNLSLVPNAADGINAFAINTPVSIISGTTTLVSTNGSGGTNTLQVALGEKKIFPMSWGPNQNLATVAIPLASRGILTTVSGVNCTPGGLAPASSSIDVWFAADAVTAANVTSSGTKINTTACAANTASGTLQDMGVTNAIVPSGSHIWIVGSGAGWAGTLTAVSGELQVQMIP